MKKPFTAFLITLAVFTAGTAKGTALPVDSIHADFREFIRYLEETHPDPYTPYGGRPYFYATARNFTESIWTDSVTDSNELARRITQFLLPLGDGHTGISQMKPKGKNRYAPIYLKQLSDGLAVALIPDSLKEFLGYTITAVNNIPLDTLIIRTGSVAITENRSGIMKHLCWNIGSENFLSQTIEGFEGDSVDFTLKDKSGHEHCIRLPLIPSTDRFSYKSYARIKSKYKLPKGNMEYCFIDDKGKSAYFRFNTTYSRDCFDYMKSNGWDYESQLWNYLSSTGQKRPATIEEAFRQIPVLAEEFGKLLKEMKKRKSDKLFIDLRNNGGGWTPIVYAMLYQLYGNKVATQDYSQQFYRKLSPLYFKKINSSLEDFNKQYNCDFTYNDYTIWGKNSEPKKELSPEELENYLSGLMTSRTDMLVRQKGEPLYRPAEVYVITDGVTFSAAYHTAHYLRQLGAKVIGVASSQAPNTFMETTPFRLTHTGLTGSISNSIQNMLPADHPEARQMKPDVELTTATFHRYGDDDNAEIRMILEP